MIPRSSRSYVTHRDPAGNGRLLRLLGVLLLLFVCYAIITTVFLTAVRAESVSMQPTVTPGDRLLVVPLLYGPRVRLFEWTLPGVMTPRRGDVVVLRPPYLGAAGALERVADPLVGFFTAQTRQVGAQHAWQNRTQIKRIVGLPGDTIRVDAFIAYIQPEGSATFLSEFELAVRPYEVDTPELPENWTHDSPFSGDVEPVTLGENEYYVLGDHRGDAVDSRLYGSVGWKDISGRVLLRYWPLSAFGAP